MNKQKNFLNAVSVFCRFVVKSYGRTTGGALAERTEAYDA